MTERLLQYIWQFQYYNRNELLTVGGERLVVIHQGTFNAHQGPDFIEGRILIDGNLWVGNIELHLQSSGWRRHLHDNDRNYDNVILHVVWSIDEDELIKKFPTLVLCDRVPKILLEQYEAWMNDGQGFIPCQASMPLMDELVWTAWKERMVIERLDRKAQQVKAMLAKNRCHWNEIFWWMLARNFGLYVNADAFEEMAVSIPVNLLLKHREQIHQLEALLFGQAGLLDREFIEKYPLMLKKEYVFLQSKYHLRPINQRVHFLRMRPACFPTVRLAQLAMLMHVSGNIFSDVIGSEEVKDVKEMLQVTANDYWHYHFRFDEQSAYQLKTLGDAMVNSILMNTVVVVLYAYGSHHREPVYQQRAARWMGQLSAESNAVIAKFKSIGLRVKSAFDSQALIELKSQYCDGKRCLDCAIGAAILKKDSPAAGA